MCAFYSPNANLKGVKSVYTSESAVSLGSSSLPFILVLPVDPAYLQNSFAYAGIADADGYEFCVTNTNKSQVIYTTNNTSGVKKDELRGQYIYVQGLDESRQIDGNTAAADGADVTVYVDRPFTTAPTAGNGCNVRRWEKLYTLTFMESLEEFAEKFIAKDSAGKSTWTNCEAAYDTIDTYKNWGGGFFYALPVEINATMGSTEAAANMAATSNSDFLADLNSITPAGVVLCKQPSLPVTVAASDWATADAAWTTLCDNRATLDSSDEDLRSMVYIADTPSASASSAITYRATTWAPTSERAVLCHGLHTVPDKINGNRSREVNCAAAFAGACNKISTTTAETFGHAFSGVKTAGGFVKNLSETLTQANKILLQSNGINALITKEGSGYYFENQWTMAANTNTAGENPEEYLHIMVSANKIWDAARNRLRPLIDEQNVASRRRIALTQLTVLLEGYKTQNVIRSYSVADATTTNDESLGIARFNTTMLFPVPIGYVELTINRTI